MVDFSGLANAMQTLAEIIGQDISNTIRSFGKLLTPFRDYSNGRYAIVAHDDTGRFEGHICERLSHSTVTVARATDGVLVSVPKDAVITTKERE